MPLVNSKIQPPRYDSDRDIPPIAEFESLMLAFLGFQEHGQSLVELIMRSQQRKETEVASFLPSSLPPGLLLSPEELLELNVNPERTIETYGDLDEEERQLDREMKPQRVTDHRG